MDPYLYEPLLVRKGHIRHKQCIRLVTLLPGLKNDPIRIQISRASVEGAFWPVYEALSYTWGEQEPLHQIEVVVARGISRRPRPRATFKVGPNLHLALFHLRRRDTERVLWVDAICLDQRNPVEKSLEIGKMGDIYKKAKNVVVWLGKGSAATEGAFQAMSLLGRQVQWIAGENGLIPAENCDAAWNRWTDDSFVVPFDTKTWLAIADVLESEWFRRVWIWQEICLANRNSTIVQCGTSSLPWEMFQKAIVFFNMDADSGATDCREEFQISLKPATNVASIPQNRHLLGLLGVTRRCGCTDPRDRIYGLLGLATRADVPEDKLLARLKPNYEGKTIAQLYKDFAVGEIKTMCRLSILWHCDAFAWNHKNPLPSWVPDWTIELPYKNLNLGVFGGGRGALGLGDSFGRIDNDLLKVNGTICDAVRSCSAVASRSVGVLEMTSIIRTWFKVTFGESKPPTTETLVALCHSLAEGYIGNRFPERYRPASLQAAKDIITDIIAASQTATSSKDIVLPDQAVMFAHMSNTLPGRRIFITDTGKIGLGPVNAEPDDQVVSIIGSKRLMLLRPSRGGNFRIVGLCYLHGLMDLEAILGPLPEDYSVQLVGSCDDPWHMRFVQDGGMPSPQDPRLLEFFEGWRSDQKDTDGATLWYHVDSRTTTKSDPRHTDVGFLQKRGVAIREICIE